MPLTYVDECKQAGTIDGDNLCFTEDAFLGLRKKYSRYTISATYEVGDEPISGCCDRADQY